jgi:hypothetical protein
MTRTFTQSEITVERMVNGGYSLSVITDTGNYYRMRYFLYSRKEAMREFTQYVREQEQAI